LILLLTLLLTLLLLLPLLLPLLLLSSLDFAFDLPLTAIPFITTDAQQPDPSLHLFREKRKSNPADKSVRPTPDWM